MGHQIQHQQSKASNKQMSLLCSPLQKQLEEGAVDASASFSSVLPSFLASKNSFL
jgi:hypothetical protein